MTAGLPHITAEDADPPLSGQGILFSTAEILKTPLDLARLWLHEAERVYGDKMVDEKDQETLHRVTIASTKKFFDVGQATGSLCCARKQSTWAECLGPWSPHPPGRALGWAWEGTLGPSKRLCHGVCICVRRT